MTKSRRRFLAVAASQLILLPLSTTRVSAAIDTEDLDEFQRILKSALRARRPEEIQFIEKTVGLIRNGTLPRRIVEAAFVWVRKKKYRERYPAVWFERSLRALAAREGINIP